MPARSDAPQLSALPGHQQACPLPVVARITHEPWAPDCAFEPNPALPAALDPRCSYGYTFVTRSPTPCLRPECCVGREYTLFSCGSSGLDSIYRDSRAFRDFRPTLVNNAGWSRHRRPLYDFMIRPRTNPKGRVALIATHLEFLEFIAALVEVSL